VEEAVTAAPSVCRTPPRAVPLPRIHEALRSLWRTCAPQAGEGDVARSLAVNFVGVAAAADEPGLRQAVDRLQGRTPCRAFLLVVDAAATQATAAVSAATRGSGPALDIVLEEIAIRMPGSGFSAMPGLIRPLLVNDLPSHLFWGAPWPEDERTFDGMAQLCDHVVVDTRRFSTPQRELDLLAARRGGGQRLTDLNWLRLRPWRRALAEAFERFPWRPGAAASGTIVHGAAGHAAAMLLAQWLAARTGASMRLDAARGATGTCPQRVELRTGGHDVQIEALDAQLVVHVTAPEHCWLPFKVPASRGSDGDLLAAAIDLG
jgi:glucose-6-phosphate dehydrogenase assembly protein OpcA